MYEKLPGLNKRNEKNGKRRLLPLNLLPLTALNLTAPSESLIVHNGNITIAMTIAINFAHNILITFFICWNFRSLKKVFEMRMYDVDLEF